MFSDLLQQLLLALLPNEPVYYIGGSEVLPPPLSREEETAALTALCAGEKSAERTLIEHNLRKRYLIDQPPTHPRRRYRNIHQ